MVTKVSAGYYLANEVDTAMDRIVRTISDQNLTLDRDVIARIIKEEFKILDRIWIEYPEQGTGRNKNEKSVA